MVDVPTFRRKSLPKTGAVGDVIPKREPFRRSRHERGYDARWDRLQVSFLRLHPLCAECERRGLTRVAEMVDHIIPVRDAPERRLDRSNLQSLCRDCHDIWKRRLENFARRRGLIHMLTKWCRDITSRPKAISA